MLHQYQLERICRSETSATTNTTSSSPVPGVMKSAVWRDGTRFSPARRAALTNVAACLFFVLMCSCSPCYRQNLLGSCFLLAVCARSVFLFFPFLFLLFVGCVAWCWFAYASFRGRPSFPAFPIAASYLSSNLHSSSLSSFKSQMNATAWPVWLAGWFSSLIQPYLRDMVHAPHASFQNVRCRWWCASLWFLLNAISLYILFN